MKNHPSRSIPAITNLVVFDACARQLSFTRAGKAIGLTQGAVSRQILELEAYLGQALFVRGPKSLRLTEAGKQYAGQIRPHLDALEQATRAQQSGREPSRTLRVTASVSLCNQWLVKRLPDFLAAHPDLSVSLHPEMGDAGAAPEDSDLAILNRPLAPADHPSELLFPINVIPVCAPALLAGRAALQLRELLDLPLLHYAEAPQTWTDYAHAAGLPGIHVPVQSASTSFMVHIQSALAALGVALLPEFLIADELAAGKLVRAHGFCLRTRHAYHLVDLKPQGPGSPVLLLREWLLQQASPWREHPAEV